MYSNTGRGGDLLNHLYDYDYNLREEIRSHPITFMEFLSFGITKTIYVKYIEILNELYETMYSLEVNSKYGSVSFNYNVSSFFNVWKKLNEFCIKQKLILEYSDSTGNIMPPEVTSEVENLRFVVINPEREELISILSFDDFRLIIERSLSKIGENEYILFETGYILSRKCCDSYDTGCLEKIDLTSNKMVIATKTDVNDTLSRLKARLSQIQQKIDNHEKNVPKPCIQKKYLCSYDEEYTSLFDLWVHQYLLLTYELNLAENSVSYVEEIFESGAYNDDSKIYEDSYLYVYKGTLDCISDKHSIKSAKAIFFNKYGNKISMFVEYCEDCKRFYISHYKFKKYREKYGIILGRFRMLDTYDFSDLAEESPLKLCGYSVSQKDGLYVSDRQSIIDYCIESGAMSKAEVLRLLRWLIDVNGSKRGNETALSKWVADYDYVIGNSKHNMMITESIHIKDSHFIIMD